MDAFPFLWCCSQNKCQQKSNWYTFKENHSWCLKESKKDFKVGQIALQWTEPKLSLWKGKTAYPIKASILFSVFSGSLEWALTPSNLNSRSTPPTVWTKPSICILFWQIFIVLLPCERFGKKVSSQAKGFEIILKQSFLHEDF